MPHPQTIPSSSLYWEHTKFEGRRYGTPADNSPRRWWGVSYAGFGSSNDADAFPDAAPVANPVPVRVRGDLVDRFFWDAELGQYTQTEAQVGACLYWLLTQNPTASELANTENLALTRARMAGASMFGGAFTVTALPAERAEEQ
jgi:hypothetical protein